MSRITQTVPAVTPQSWFSAATKERLKAAFTPAKSAEPGDHVAFRAYLDAGGEVATTPRLKPILQVVRIAPDGVCRNHWLNILSCDEAAVGPLAIAAMAVQSDAAIAHIASQGLKLLENDLERTIEVLIFPHCLFFRDMKPPMEEAASDSFDPLSCAFPRARGHHEALSIAGKVLAAARLMEELQADAFKKNAPSPHIILPALEQLA